MMPNPKSSSPSHPIRTVTIGNERLTVEILSYGASVQSIKLEGYDHSLILGAKDPNAYRNEAAYFGSVVGPVAGRIANGQGVLNGNPVTLEKGIGSKHHLHGGPQGLAQLSWQVLEHSPESATLQITLPDQHSGYPGPSTFEAEYRVVGATLRVELRAVSEQQTLCNLATHCYFNLDGSNSVLKHLLKVAATHYTPTDQEMIPTGEVTSVSGTAYDYRSLREIGGKGYKGLDMNFCIASKRRSLSFLAKLVGPQTGIELEVWSTEPGLQIYDGSHITLAAKDSINEIELSAGAGLAMEPQSWPDAPNQSNFPSVSLLPSQQYQQVTEFRFS